ncbi:MAG: dihydrolipoyl dehydrogenase, partial [Oscillospiraceae bacterium]
IASVGLTADQAKERGIAVRVGKFLMSANAKSLLTAQERGFVKLVFDAQSEVLLGAQLMCARATDLIGELS